ncbi:SGNH/GDSL hydrolase family protein [Streptomyces sp. SKN60]|uniref:SGNH/GDSL hydrolase family protein n=1 Tax=Streptomyces sp. SKN60 TaxID=2855506 RepID=UPI0022473987|nr:SGNH/GDSL hydrolase family protein [Streptomyces sp. SKN60]MCX2181296.1 SGNH/GDSL hydrolase family protein [Streptomyces sp. SKN60]
MPARRSAVERGDIPVSSFVALGDSFTEGLGDETPDGALLGWADRLALMLADRSSAPFRYANLAVRGRVIDEIVEEQVPQVAELTPDLVSFCAGGNDILRWGSSVDRIAERFEEAVVELGAGAKKVLVFTGFDPRGTPVLRRLRGKIATYTAHVHAIADRHGCLIVDLWSMKALQHPLAWSDDRLHLSSEGHRRVALRAAEILGLGPMNSGPAPDALQGSGRQPQRLEDLRWAKEHFLPWLGEHLLGRASDEVPEPKRPELLPL